MSYEVDYLQLGRRIDQIPDEVQDLLRLFDGHRTLDEIIRASGLRAPDARRVIDKLKAEGIVVDASPQAATHAHDTELTAWLAAGEVHVNGTHGQTTTSPPASELAHTQTTTAAAPVTPPPSVPKRERRKSPRTQRAALTDAPTPTVDADLAAPRHGDPSPAPNSEAAPLPSADPALTPLTPTAPRAVSPTGEPAGKRERRKSPRNARAARGAAPTVSADPAATRHANGSAPRGANSPTPEAAPLLSGAPISAPGAEQAATPLAHPSTEMIPTPGAERAASPSADSAHAQSAAIVSSPDAERARSAGPEASAETSDRSSDGSTVGASEDDVDESSVAPVSSLKVEAVVSLGAEHAAAPLARDELIDVGGAPRRVGRWVMVGVAAVGALIAVVWLARSPAPSSVVAAAAPAVIAAPPVVVAEPVVAEPVVEPVVEPESDEDVVGPARALFEKGQVKAAIASLEAALARKPKDDRALVLLAHCHLEIDAVDKAIANAASAVLANPNNAEAYLVGGAAQQHAGRNSDARTAYEKYLQLAPRGQYAGEITSILRTLR